MAKKKKRKRRVQEAPAVPLTPRARQERKEVARRERERIIRAARRRRLIRGIAVWAVVAVVAAGLGYWIWRQVTEAARIKREGAAAARALGCGEIQDLASEGRGHLQPGSTAPEYGTTPATSGMHSPSTLPPNVHVYEQEIPEPLAVHNLEHAYVIVYYRAQGQASIPQNVREALAELAESQEKVILAPYPDLAEGTSLSFVAWTKLQECPRVTDADAAVSAAQGFIEQFRGTDNAPEPSAG
jgi:hypothetical protein